MFDTWDDIEKLYNVLISTGEARHLTTQELYEYFLFNDTGIKGEFVDLKVRLDKGESVAGDFYEWDWSLGTNAYRGRITITRSNKTNMSQHKSNTGKLKCDHRNKYINEAGGTKFWFCKDCKSDLGDA
jgi:hypothetical protein